jgi:hypothetical protein
MSAFSSRPPRFGAGKSEVQAKRKKEQVMMRRKVIKLQGRGEEVGTTEVS